MSLPPSLAPLGGTDFCSIPPYQLTWRFNALLPLSTAPSTTSLPFFHQSMGDMFWLRVDPVLLCIPGSYTCHAEPSMRVVAEEALLSVVRGCPHLRNNIVCTFANFTASLPDNAEQVG